MDIPAELLFVLVGALFLAGCWTLRRGRLRGGVADVGEEGFARGGRAQAAEKVRGPRDFKVGKVVNLSLGSDGVHLDWKVRRVLGDKKMILAHADIPSLPFVVEGFPTKGLADGMI